MLSSLEDMLTPRHRTLVVGSDGVIGRSLCQQLASNGATVVRTTRRKHVAAADLIYIDLHDPGTFVNLGCQQFDSVIICGAVTSVDMCEKCPDYSRSVNVKGTLEIIKRTIDLGAHIVFISSNMVFDGSEPFCHSNAPTSPITEYGRQKVEVEEWLLVNDVTATVMRFGKILKERFPLFDQWIDQLLLGEKIEPFSNKTLAPISLQVATEVLAWIIAKKRTGILQLTAEREVTYDEIARYIALRLKVKESLISPALSCINGMQHSENANQRLFSTLQISSELMRLSHDYSPYAAVDYSLSS